MLKTHLQTVHVIFTLPHSRKGLELFKETKVANTKSVKICNFCESKIKKQKSLKPHLQTIHVIPTLPHSRKGLKLIKETKVANKN